MSERTTGTSERRPSRARRAAVTVIAAVLLVAMAAPTGFATPAAAADAALDTDTLIDIDGTILVLSGQASDALTTTLLPEEVRVVTAGGDSVEITGALGKEPQTGAAFAGTVSIPDSALAEFNAEIVVSDAAAGSDVVDGESELGREIIEFSAATDEPLVVEAAVVTPETSAAQTGVAHTVNYAVVTLPSDPSATVVSDSEIDTLTTRSSTYWKSQTAGQVESITRSGAIDRFASASACDPRTVWEEASARLGYPSSMWWKSANRHLVVIAPLDCDGAGLGTVGSSLGGGLVWARYRAPVIEVILNHELGHNFSLRHSDSYVCSTAVSEGAGCSTSAYQDYYDVMGGALSVGGTGNAQLPALNLTHKSRLGSLAATDLLPVSLPSGTGSTANYTLNPASAMSGLRGLSITDPGTGARYYVEFRSGTGIDSGSLYSRRAYQGLAPGVRVLRLRADQTSSVLTKAAARSRNLYLGAGQSLVAESGKLTVSVVSIGATASVDIVLGDGGSSSTAEPVTATVPRITGSPTQGGLLRADPGAWGPAPVTFGYQWMRNGQPILGATLADYVPASADAGARITVAVTGVKPGYRAVTSTSEPTASVIGMLSTVVPTVSGLAETGNRLTAVPGSWAPSAAQLSYQWLRNGALIDGATTSGFDVTEVDIGTQLAVRVLGTLSGYTEATRVSAPTSTVAQGTIPVQRFGGADRYASAVRVSANYPSGVPVVYIASGANYPDALSAAPAAAAAGGPLLLTAPSSVPESVAAELRRLRPAQIVVVGGPASVSAFTYRELSAFAPSITRVGGADRYATSRAVVDYAFAESGASRVYVATGRNFPDALSASAAAGARGGAVLLVDGGASTIDDASTALIRALHPVDVVIAGGPAVVSAGIEAAAKALGRPGGAFRLGGTDRYESGRTINAEAFDGSDAVFIATGTNFPDALAGAALAGKTGAPLYVVPGGCVTRTVLADIKRSARSSLVILGGPASVSVAVESLRSCG